MRASLLLLAWMTGCALRGPAIVLPESQRWTDDETWTESPLDDALAEPVSGCHIRVETVGEGRRIRERWESPDWSLVIAQGDQEATQVRARVTRRHAQLEAFASLSADADFDRRGILQLLAHPPRRGDPRFLSLARVYQEERYGRTTLLEEYGLPELVSRLQTQERDGGVIAETRLLWKTGRSARRAWVDDEGRHQEWHTRRDGSAGDYTSVVLEERNEAGQVVSERWDETGPDGSHDWMIGYDYDGDGRLLTPEPYERRADELEIEIERDGAGNPTRVVVRGRYEMEGVWDHGRLVRASTRSSWEHARFAFETLTRSYDSDGRLTRSVLSQQPSEGPALRSVMTIRYEGCAADVQVMWDPAHISPLEIAFDER
ncbi:MAG: hypothetical protein CMN30_07425 [Sandaracinus sp.]|nr:hypothetical protein [Sandaracinus sp.]